MPERSATVVVVGIFVVQGHMTGRYVLDQPVGRDAAVGARPGQHAGGTLVELKLDQKLQGANRFGGFLVKRAARKQLTAALEALAEISRSATPSG